MKAIKDIFSTLLVIASLSVVAQQTPAPKQSEIITINGATAHLGNGKVIEQAIIMLQDGKITAVADARTSRIALQGNIIDASGKHVYPGFIATNTTLGLVEVGAVRQTNDDDEIGDFIPHVRGIIAYNAESKVVESMRPNGVLMAQTRPVGGRISGTSSVVQLDAWNWEDAAYRTDDGVWLNWPRSMTQGRWWMGEDPGFTPSKNYQKQITEIKDFMKNASAFAKANAKETNLAFAAMKGVINGSQNLYVTANGAREIADIIAFKKEMDVKNLVLVGGYEAPRVAADLVANNISVILQRVQETPAIGDHDYDYNYKLAKLLTDAGVRVALGYDGEYWQVRNLPFYAGQLTGQGMDSEAALQLITQNPAIILGIDTTTGTIEVGKDATLFISEGDALDMRTNVITKAFIQGRDISLESHQTKLYKRYNTKAQNGE